MNIEILIGRNLNQSESIILNHFMDPFFVLNSNIYFLSYVFCQEMPFLDIWNPQKRQKLVYYAKKPLAPQIYVGPWDIISIHHKIFFCIFLEKNEKNKFVWTSRFSLVEIWTNQNRSFWIILWIHFLCWIQIYTFCPMFLVKKCTF